MGEGPAGRATRPAGRAKALALELLEWGEAPGLWPREATDWLVRWLYASEEMLAALDGPDAARTLRALAALESLGVECEGLLARLKVINLETEAEDGLRAGGE